MKEKIPFSKDVLILNDPGEIVNKICDRIREDIYKKLRRSGGVIGISGGIDSSVTYALSVKALGPDKVLGVMLPEKDSSKDSEKLAQKLSDQYKTRVIKEDITSALDGFETYKRRDEAVSRIFPDYDPEKHKMKIGIKKSGLLNNLPPLFSLILIDEEGNEHEKRMGPEEYRQIVAASNFKQRTRMSFLYYHAELNNYAVIGTPNKHERDQGFFVKHGDGAADLMPISNLYKSQVYQIGEYLGVPGEIMQRTPTTDTYTAEQTQEDFFFQLPFEELDLYWFGFENGYSPEEVGKLMNESAKNVEAIFRNFKRKIQSTEYLRMSPIDNY